MVCLLLRVRWFALGWYEVRRGMSLAGVVRDAHVSGLRTYDREISLKVLWRILCLKIRYLKVMPDFDVRLCQHGPQSM